MEFTKDQIYIVTGASSGIGQGTALLLNELGATVVAIARSENKLKEAKLKAKFPDNFHFEVKDLADDIANLPKYVSSLKEKYGKFSGMVCSAGISENMSLKGLYFEDIERSFNINYFSPIFMIKGMIDKRNNIGKGTSIVAISSIAMFTSDPGMTAYAGAKAGLTASLKVIAKEVAPQGIRVNAISPALIETPMADDLSKAYGEGKYPFGFGEVSDAANMIIFLLSNKSKWLTRQNYIIDCGSY